MRSPSPPSRLLYRPIKGAQCQRRNSEVADADEYTGQSCWVEYWAGQAGGPPRRGGPDEVSEGGCPVLDRRYLSEGAPWPCALSIPTPLRRWRNQH